MCSTVLWTVLFTLDACLADVVILRGTRTMSLRIDSSLNANLNSFPHIRYIHFSLATNVPLLSAENAPHEQDLPLFRKLAARRGTSRSLHSTPFSQRNDNMARNTTSAHIDNAACTANHGDAAVYRAGRMQPQVPDHDDPDLLLSGASQFSNHGSHDDPAAAGTHTTPTRMKIPAMTEAVTVTTTTPPPPPPPLRM
ncbi:hypothetical protein EDB85DRAFT_1898200 [Lactarius pseudohatsudake]|nr:hypothetical protein EDB85DRAFT_1898200 [Lactarius pseudohatsudake]